MVSFGAHGICGHHLWAYRSRKVLPGAERVSSALVKAGLPVETMGRKFDLARPFVGCLSPWASALPCCFVVGARHP